MDEEIAIIDKKTRNEKIKSFLIENKKKLIAIFLFLILILISTYSYQIYNDIQRERVTNKYNIAVIKYENGDKSQITLSMKEIIEKKDSTYSPLGLYFLIDNDLIKDNVQMNELFDLVINKIKLEKEIKNLIIYKKALYNSNFVDENELLQILNPIINSESIWKSHALYLVAEYFYSKNDIQKSKEFFNQILILPNRNKEIELETKKRINRDLSE